MHGTLEYDQLKLSLAFNDPDLQDVGVRGLACHHDSFRTKILKMVRDIKKC